MSKVVVFCGQRITHKMISNHENIVMFPEASMGNQDVIDMVRLSVRQDMVYVTRCGTVINALGELIEENILKAEDVIIHLFNNNQWTEHKFTEEGYLAEGWPYGVLGY